jgi:hypothetical protein
MNDKRQNILKALCSQCKQETNHRILHSVNKSINYMDAVYIDSCWQIIECNGCENISFRQSSISSEDYDHYTGRTNEHISLYPNISIDTLAIKTYYNIPQKVKVIYRETIEAYNNDQFILCSAGLRAIIEGICNSEGITKGLVEIEQNGEKKLVNKSDLRGKIGGLYEKGLLTKNHADFLHEHRFLGNSALHTLQQPTKKELKLAIEIVEHTLDNIYELSEKVNDLRHENKKIKK